MQEVKSVAFHNFPIPKENAVELSKLIGINQQIFEIIEFETTDIFTSYNRVVPMILKEMADIEED